MVKFSRYLVDNSYPCCVVEDIGHAVCLDSGQTARMRELI